MYPDQSVQNNDEANPRASSVSNYACKEEPNFRYRPRMEDGHIIRDRFMNDQNSGAFLVVDGHGGPEASEYCKNRMLTELQKSINANRNNIQQALHQCFTKIDDQLRLTGAVSVGTTATLAYICNEQGQKVLYVANVGDSKAVLVGRQGAQQLSAQHHGSDPSEIDRIVNSGGSLIYGRVGGTLAVTRALGDHHLRNCGVIPDPHVTRHVLQATDEFLVIATDGLWDAVENEELVQFSGLDSQKITEGLLEKALPNSYDNICIITICF